MTTNPTIAEPASASDDLDEYEFEGQGQTELQQPAADHPVYAYVDAQLPPPVNPDHPFYRARQGMAHEALRHAWKSEAWKREPVTDPRPMTTEQLLAQTYPEANDLIEGMVAANGLNATIAAKKVGKTFLSIQKAICVGAGVPFMERDTVQGAVLLIEEEGSQRRFQERVQRLIASLEAENGRPLRPDVRWLHRQHFNISTPEGIARLRRVVEEYRPIYLPIGPLSYVGHMQNENDNAEMQRLARSLLDLSIEFEMTVDIAHHRNKPPKEGTPKGVGAWFDGARGASALIGATDSNNGLDRDPDREEGRFYQLNRDGRSFMEHYRFDPVTLLHVPITDDEAQRDNDKATIESIRDWMRPKGTEPITAGEVATHFAVSKDTASRRLAVMQAKQWVLAYTGAPRGTKYYRLIDAAARATNE